jgi:hypothetical protein
MLAIYGHLKKLARQREIALHSLSIKVLTCLPASNKLTAKIIESRSWESKGYVACKPV